MSRQAALRSNRSHRTFQALRRCLPELNFLTLHYAYFTFTSLLTAIILWGSSTPFRSVKFIDAFFLTSSAMTEAGLNTVNLSTLNTFQQVILFLLIILGSAIFVSAFVVFVRLRSFDKEFETVIRRRRKQKRLNRIKGGNSQDGNNIDSERTMPASTDFAHDDETTPQPAQTTDSYELKDVLEHSEPIILQARGRTTDSKYTTSAGDSHSPSPSPTTKHIIFRPDTKFNQSPGNGDSRADRFRHLFPFDGVGARSRSDLVLQPRSISAVSRSSTMGSNNSLKRAQSTEPWFRSAAGYFVRNSAVEGLTFEERQELGGCEYSAVLLLSFLVPIYFFLWQFLGCIALGAWINNHRASTAEANGINPWWLGAFNAVSAFNNSGMSLLDANMTAFQDAIFMLLSMGLFILAGNTAYPIFLRGAVWSMWKALPDNEYWKFDKDTLRFLLDHPRRCYTNMFPSRDTWWLGLALITLNGVDWAAFEILNIGNKQITALLPGYEAIDGLFQALAVRSGGFYVVPIPNVRISLQVLYVMMMYISAFPVAITMRNSNVYEERSLGLSAEEQEEPESPVSDKIPEAHGANDALGRFKRTAAWLTADNRNRKYFLRHQIHAQLAHDLWWLALAVFIIMIIEGGQFEQDPTTFSVFNVIFEVVSGYGTVGISIGVPNEAYSFCGAWRTLSKLVLIAVMIRGRHRGLPVAIDHAVQLPSTGFEDKTS